MAPNGKEGRASWWEEHMEPLFRKRTEELEQSVSLLFGGLSELSIEDGFFQGDKTDGADTQQDTK